MYAMEDNKFLMFLDSVKTNIVASFIKEPNKLSPIKALEASKNKFEEEMQFSSASALDKVGACVLEITVERYVFDKRFIRFFSKDYSEDKSPYDFLRYCYYQQHHSGQGEWNLKQLVECSDLFDICQRIQINGFSALGAAFLSQDVLCEEKYKFFELLMRHGFEWTENDKMLIQFYFYNAIPLKEKQTMILLLCDHKEDNLSVLPCDVRKYIVACMVHFLKQQRALELENYAIIKRIFLGTNV